MKCPECKNKRKNPFDKFSIKKQKRCVDCQNKYLENHPELDPENKEYEIEYRYYDDESEQREEDAETVYAKTAEDAVSWIEDKLFCDIEVISICEMDRG